MTNKSKSKGYVSASWSPFSEKLTGVLGKLEEDQFLIVSIKGSKRFVQFAAQGSFGMRVETTSNSYLDKPEQLNRRQVAALVELGWSDPTGSGAESTPENDPDGSPNFFLDFSTPVPYQFIADLTVRTLTEILRVPYPGSLQYEAFQAPGQVIALPELGLKYTRQALASSEHEEVPQQLLAVLEAKTGLTNLEYDSEGDIGISYGSAVIFVRLIGNPLFVRFYSRILNDVEQADSILTRLNDMNAREPMVYFVARGDAIFAIADICAAPFVADHVFQAMPHFCSIVDGIDSLLQAEFGGQTALTESMPSSTRH